MILLYRVGHITHFGHLVSRDNVEITPTPTVKMVYEGDVCTLTISKTHKDQDGVYKCVAENPAGEADTTGHITIEGQYEYEFFLDHSHITYHKKS